MPTIRFVHAADLHLDSPFLGIRSDAPELVTQTLRNATFSAYENIIGLCLREQVDALLIAGDVYDGADRSLRAQLKFVAGLEQLDAAGIRSFICHGNHDPLDGWEAQLAPPRGCVRFGSDVTAAPLFPGEPERAVVYGISYPQREVRRDLSPLFRKAGLSRGLNIGLLHANVGGNPNHDSYAPCSVDDLAVIDIDYWALGHIHTRNVLRQGNPAIVYPGPPQGRHPNELGVHGVYLVELDQDGSVRLEFRPMDVLRWNTRELDITGLDSEHLVLDAIDELASAAIEEAAGRSVVLRLRVTGRGPMHRFLRQPENVSAILEQLNDQYANDEPWLWCERLQANTASSVDRNQVAQQEDFAGDLVRLASEVQASSSDLAELRELLRDLYIKSNASQYLRGLLPSDDELRELVNAAEDECLAALAEDEDRE